MTANEIIAIAFTRNISEQHIKPADIAIATRQYVDSYITGYDITTEFYTDFIKPVIAYGVACNIFNRLSAEITDRGVVQMISQGATIMNAESKRLTLMEYELTRDYLIEMMCEQSDAVLIEDNEFQLVGFTGNEKGAML